jgi:heat-inducible transcriptional repressor
VNLNPRTQEVLSTLVRHHIETGGAVSSSTVVKKAGLKLSPATVRNILADLDEKGYLAQPHTSAGRVPTDLGYRFFVNNLMDHSSLSQEDAAKIIQRYRLSIKSKVLGELLQETSQILSEFSHYIGWVMAPTTTNVRYNHMKFIGMGNREILVILVSESGIVQIKEVSSDAQLSQEELDALTDSLNQQLSGLTLDEVRKRIILKMKEDMRTYREILQKVFLMSEISEPQGFENRIYLEGTPNMLEHVDFTENIEKMKRIFQAFTKKSNLVQLLDHSMHTEGVLVSIGAENHHRMLEDCSLVTANYKCNNQVVGTLGVIGPRRMNYSQVIPVVDYTSRVLSRLIH